MRTARWSTAAVGLLASLAISAVLWWYLGTVVFFLFVPFVPFVLRPRRQPMRTCPRCGFRSDDPDVAYCPRDGTRLSAGEDR
ncbi:MAG: hypothetical protein ACOC0X_04025 [Halobacteriota archaeon]